LVVEFPIDSATLRALDSVSLTIEAAQKVALVGESGSGKSTLALATLGLVPPPGEVVSGTVTTCGIDMLAASPAQLRDVRGGRTAMIFQDALGSLNPVMSVGAQLVEAIRIHRNVSKAEAEVGAAEALREVGIRFPESRLRQYPHEFSGGMRQRVMIAMALSCQPELLVADEPTTALDVTTQAAIMELLTAVASARGMATLFITHDLGLVAGFADFVVVMYAGVVVEFARVDELFANPRHPYTRRLLRAVPRLDSPRSGLLPTIPGALPNLSQPVPACRFQPRCALSKPACLDRRPPLAMTGADHASACYFSDEPDVADTAQGTGPTPRGNSEAPATILRVAELVKEYQVRAVWYRRQRKLRAVDEVSLTIRVGESLGLVGETGAGKSTVARVLLGLTGYSRGEIEFEQSALRQSRHRRPGWSRGEMQVVFQDPGDSLNPRKTVDRIIAEPMLLLSRYAGTDVARRTDELLNLVGLGPDYRKRRPPELSGGQKQRVAIARALATNPKLVICDEAVSSLDVSIRAQILNLLKKVQADLGVSYLFITHDLAVVRHVCDRVAIMYAGAIVEIGDTEAVISSPQHPYSKALLSAVPIPDPVAARTRRRIELPDSSGPDTAAGCPFRERCWKSQDICATETPRLEEYAPAHQSACHFPELNTPRREPSDNSADPAPRIENAAQPT
jgi:peptide/nickel transport system ATP-binding protein